MRVVLHFDMIVNVEVLDDLDSLGNDIAHDVLCELFNGEDALGVEFKGWDFDG